MFGLFQRPKLEASFAATEAVSNEFTREIDLAGRLELRNDGSDADLSSVEMMIIAGFRRIPLEVPGAVEGVPAGEGRGRSRRTCAGS